MFVEKNQRFVNDAMAVSNCYFTFYPVASVILR